MKYCLSVFLLLCPLLLAGCGGSDDSTDTASAGDPDKLYNQKCSICHGSNLEGGGGPNLEAVGAKYSAEEIEKIIVEGKGGMPAGALKGEDAKAVAEWLSEKK